MNNLRKLAGLLLASAMSIAIIGAGEGAAHAADPVATATGASAAQTAASTPSGAATAAPLLFDINGSWTDYGPTRPVISMANSTIFVDMSFAHRPNATGIVVDASTISVRFPDDATYIGRLQAPNVIRWSNGSTWEKVYAGPLVINLRGHWSDRVGSPFISELNGFISVDMSFAGRPAATGFALDASTILVTFPDVHASFVGRLQAAPLGQPSIINWSNGTWWYMLPIH
jgi:hypothetical protein